MGIDINLKFMVELAHKRKGGKTVNDNLKISMAAARVNANLTQADVAREMKVSKQTIVNWEKGKVSPPFAQFKLFCEIVGISEDNIFLPES